MPIATSPPSQRRSAERAVLSPVFAATGVVLWGAACGGLIVMLGVAVSGLGTMSNAPRPTGSPGMFIAIGLSYAAACLAWAAIAARRPRLGRGRLVAGLIIVLMPVLLSAGRGPLGGLLVLGSAALLVLMILAAVRRAGAATEPAITNGGVTSDRSGAAMPISGS